MRLLWSIVTHVLIFKSTVQNSALSEYPLEVYNTQGNVLASYFILLSIVTGCLGTYIAIFNWQHSVNQGYICICTSGWQSNHNAWPRGLTASYSLASKPFQLHAHSNYMRLQYFLLFRLDQAIYYIFTHLIQYQVVHWLTYCIPFVQSTHNLSPAHKRN